MLGDPVAVGFGSGVGDPVATGFAVAVCDGTAVTVGCAPAPADSMAEVGTGARSGVVQAADSRAIASAAAITLPTVFRHVRGMRSSWKTPNVPIRLFVSKQREQVVGRPGCYRVNRVPH